MILSRVAGMQVGRKLRNASSFFFGLPVAFTTSKHAIPVGSRCDSKVVVELPKSRLHTTAVVSMEAIPLL